MKASFHECDITPPLGGHMPGYYAPELAEDVFDRLYAKAVVIENNDIVTAIVSVDTCFIPADMHDIVTKRIYEYTGIKPENVCITSNHTHRGAPVNDSPEINTFKDNAYTDVFYRLTADAVILAYKRLSDIVLSFAEDEIQGIAFNRISVLEDGCLKTNHFGPRNGTLSGIDPSLNVIMFEREGKQIGAIVNYALHQDCTDGIPGYSGDYASILSKELKKVYGNDFVSVFVLGACGDINHYDYDKILKGEFDRCQYKNIGKIMAEKVIAASQNAVPLSGEIAVIKEKITLKKRTVDEKEALNVVRKYAENNLPVFMSRNIMHYASTNTTDECEVYIQAMAIGDVCLYVLPGEIYVNFGLQIKDKSPFKKNIVIENSNSYLGYVPIPEAFDEKGLVYEIALCNHSCLVPAAGQEIVNKALELGNKLKG